MLSYVQENQEDPLSFPHPTLPGFITMAFRESRLREIGLLSFQKQRKTFTVRAVMTDRQQPNNCSLEEVVTFLPSTHVTLLDGPFPAFKYYSNGKAVLFDLICDGDKRLTYIQTYVSAKLPELALGYARAAVNQFIDLSIFRRSLFDEILLTRSGKAKNRNMCRNCRLPSRGTESIQPKNAS